jgi:hypothetical protein
MLYSLLAGDPDGTHESYTVEGPVGLDLAALWVAFKRPVDVHTGEPPEVTDRVAFESWEKNRDAHLAEIYLGLTGKVLGYQQFPLTRVFEAWLCRHHGATVPATTYFMTEA